MPKVFNGAMQNWQILASKRISRNLVVNSQGVFFACQPEKMLSLFGQEELEVAYLDFWWHFLIYDLFVFIQFIHLFLMLKCPKEAQKGGSRLRIVGDALEAGKWCWSVQDLDLRHTNKAVHKRGSWPASNSWLTSVIKICKGYWMISTAAFSTRVHL